MAGNRQGPDPPVKQMTIDEAREFIAGVPWRHVKMIPVGEGLSEEKAEERWGKLKHVVPDPHEYVILGWRAVPDLEFRRFCALIKQEGYRGEYVAPYRPGSVMRNRYLELDGYCYWWIYPRMLNRERAEVRKHVPISEQGRLI